jgi:chromosome segregation ATPase
MQELEKELAAVEARKPVNQEEIETAITRLDGAREDRGAISGKIEKARRERQKILADGSDAKKITNVIEEAKRQDELLEDEILGLEALLKRLEQEGKDLTIKSMNLQQDIIKEEMRPLVAQYNESGAKMGKILQNLKNCYSGSPL